MSTVLVSIVDAPCVREACAAAAPHPGVEHLDPLSDRYDGLDWLVPRSLLEIQHFKGRSGNPHAFGVRRLLDTVRDDKELRTGLDQILKRLHHYEQAYGAAQADGDRQVQAALRVAHDCTEHGARINELEDAVHRTRAEADRLDEERCIWLEHLWRAVEVHPQLRSLYENATKAVSKARSGSRLPRTGGQRSEQPGLWSAMAGAP